MVGALTVDIPINITIGKSISIILIQDSIGGHAIDANSLYLFASGFKDFNILPDGISMMNIFFDGVLYYVTLTEGYSS